MFTYIVLLILISTVVIFESKKSLHMLQQNLYNENNRYLKWIAKNKSEFLNIQLVTIFITIICLIGIFKIETVSFIFLLILIGCYAYEGYRLFERADSEQKKKPLVITKRVKRLIFTTTVLYLIPIVLFILNYDNDFNMWMLLMIFEIMCYMNLFIVLISKIINTPYEKCVYYYYLNKAKNTLKNISNLKVVGITGSYGKTSSKNILSDILNIKYNTLPTPKNLNTPNGLMITINNHLDKFTEVFIAEMGAYVRGEIKELCDLVHPKYGILTTIGTAHLESFGSEENIQKAKFELIESLPSDGIGILNGDDKKQTSYELKNDVKTVWIGIDNKDVDVRAVDIKCNNKGTSFKVIFKGDKTKYEFQTKLLGKHNVYNILAGIALGREFGIDIKDLQHAVKGVSSIEHRLELKRIGNFYQIDDAYNSNPVGAKGAVEVLGMMPGVKVCVTPGMVELGSKENEYNKIFGTQIAKYADYVVLVGEKHSRPIYEGLIEKGFDKGHIIVYNDVREAYKFISALSVNTKNDVYALFENDLPDTYNE